MSAEGLAVLATQGVAHCPSLSELHLDCKRGVHVCVCVCARAHVHASVVRCLGSGSERGGRELLHLLFVCEVWDYIQRERNRENERDREIEIERIHRYIHKWVCTYVYR